jgi:hypothetical protein
MHIFVQQNIQTLKVAMKYWRVAQMQVQDCSGDLDCDAPSLVPRQQDVGVLEKRPERTFDAVFQDDCVVWWFCASLKIGIELTPRNITILGCLTAYMAWHSLKKSLTPTSPV